LLIALFLLVNFTGFDFIGANRAAIFEAGCILLWTHLVILRTSDR